MSRIKVSRESLEYETYPAGEYLLEIGGFKPQFAKDRKSVNLRPVLRIKNHQNLNGKPVFFNANTNAGFMLREFCHASGLLMVGESPEIAARGEGGDFEFPPGEFLNFDESKPEGWQYAGPLLGRTLRIELVEVQAMKKNSKGDMEAVPNKMRNDIKRFFCAVAGCKVTHKENLIRQ